MSELEQHFTGSMYGNFKCEVADAVVSFLEPIQARYAEYRQNEDFLNQVFREGAEKARARAQETIDKVYRAVGFVCD